MRATLIASVQSVPKTPIGMSKSFRGSLRVSLYICGHLESAFPPVISNRRISLEVAYQASL